MKNKKKIIIAIVALAIIIGAVVAIITIPGSKYKKDVNDTEEAYRQNVAEVNYENTIETATPQTELYNIIKNHFEAELPEGKTEKKAIIIGYDGCRADILTEINAEKSGIKILTDNGGSLNLLYCGGVNYPAENTQDTSTAPGWCSVLTGVWADKHGITANDITKSMDYKTILTTLTEDKIIDGASFITKWAGHFSRKNATYLLETEYCEENSINVDFKKCKNNESSHEYTQNEIKKDVCSDLIFVIYEPTDATGHGKGFTHNNPEYQEAFRTGDAYAYEDISAIYERATFDTEDWLIIITSDHGGIGTNHGGSSIQERMTFVAMNKKFR